MAWLETTAGSRWARRSSSRRVWWSLKRLRQAERNHSMIRFGLLEKIGRDESPLRSPRYGVAHLGGIMGGKNYLQIMCGE